VSEEVALLARIDGSGEQLPDPRGLWQFTAALLDRRDGLTEKNLAVAEFVIKAKCMEPG